MNEGDKAITVWKDGVWTAWRIIDAKEAMRDPDWLVNISFSEACLGFNDGLLVINASQCRAVLNGQALHLTRTEFNLLLFMALHAEMIFSSERILELAWFYDSSASISQVKYYVYRLRKKIKEVFDRHEYIINERGFGYKFIPYRS